MFTGLVEGIGSVRAVKRMGGDVILTIAPPFDVSACQVGESIAVDGVCLTVTGIKGNTITVDVSEESLSRSTLGHLKQGDQVNLERALRLTDRLGGHLVLGHVDGIGKIVKKQPRGRSWLIRIGMAPWLTRYTIEKGSIAVDGISLTINRCYPDGVEVNIIPQTGKETTLLSKKVGDPVNIETDLIGKYVERLMLGKEKEEDNNRNKESGLSAQMLKTLGFGE